MNLVVSDPELTSKQRAKCVNALAGVFTKRSITRDRSVLEVAAAVTGSTFSSRSSRVSRPVRPSPHPLEPGLTPFLASRGSECSPGASRWAPRSRKHPTTEVMNYVASQEVHRVYRLL